MIDFKDYEGKCWWCGNIANSAEHIYKKSDLEREFGRGKYFSINNPLRVIQDGEEIHIGKSKSKAVKFKKNLCIFCNTTRSQPFDNSYDIFTSYFRNNEDKIYQTRCLNFEEIYGSDWHIQVSNLLKYYVKNFCCRLYDLGVSISRDIVDYMDEKCELKSLRLVLLLRDDLYTLIKIMDENKNTQTGFLHMTGVEGRQSKSKGTFYKLQTSISYRSITMAYFYSDEFTNGTNTLLLLPNLKIEVFSNSGFQEFITP